MKMNPNNKCGIISHRGVCRLSKYGARRGENTIGAFEAGIEKLEEFGFPPAIEFDVRLSKDNVPVVFHDDLVDRTTNGHGRAKDHLFSDLKKLDAGYGCTVSSLEEVLGHFKDKDVTFHIELKENNLAAIVGGIVSKKGLADRAILSAFDEDDHGSGEDPKTTSRWSDLYAVKNTVRIALIATDKKIATMGGAGAYIRAAKTAGAYAVNPRKTAITGELVAAAHEAGLLVNAWTVNGKTMYKRFSRYGVDNVFCDNPDFLIA